MNLLLKEFWEWFSMNEIDYAEKSSCGNFEKEEFFFPKFHEMISNVELTLEKKHFTDEEIENVLTIMALDNEGENVLDMLINKLSDEMTEKFAIEGIHHIQPNARWQIAVLIGRKRIRNCSYFLNMLANDDDEYVRQRAKNELNYMS